MLHVLNPWEGLRPPQGWIETLPSRSAPSGGESLPVSNLEEHSCKKAAPAASLGHTYLEKNVSELCKGVALSVAHMWEKRVCI